MQRGRCPHDADDWMYLIATGPRFIPAAEVALLLLLETVLGALLVWMIVGEASVLATVVGGLILVSVLAAHSVATLKNLDGPPSAEVVV